MKKTTKLTQLLEQRTQLKGINHELTRLRRQLEARGVKTALGVEIREELHWIASAIAAENLPTSSQTRADILAALRRMQATDRKIVRPPGSRLSSVADFFFAEDSRARRETNHFGLADGVLRSSGGRAPAQSHLGAPKRLLEPVQGRRTV